jgi:8-oxo-dGTP diphosphatase
LDWVIGDWGVVALTQLPVAQVNPSLGSPHYVLHFFVPVGVTIVVAAVIERDDRFLVTLRPAGTHLEGHWEFPGGKCLPTETHAEALRRELHEELDIVGQVKDCVYRVTHTYPDRIVALHFYRCAFIGEPKPMLGQQIAWVPRARLLELPFPAADASLIVQLSREAG